MNREYSIDEFTYLSDICDEIDRLIERIATNLDDKERRNDRAAVRSLIVLYENHIGRKAFNKI